MQMNNVNISREAALAVLKDDSLYRDTRLIKHKYILYMPEFGTRVVDKYSSYVSRTSNVQPFILESAKGHYVCIAPKDLMFFTCEDDRQIDKYVVFEKFGRTETWGTKRSKAEFLVITPSPLLMSVKMRALHIPTSCKFQFDMANYVNNPNLKHGRSGDYIVKMALNGAMDVRLVNGAVFETLYDKHNFRSDVMNIMDTRISQLLVSTLAY